MKHGGTQAFWNAVGARTFFWDSEDLRWMPFDGASLTQTVTAGHSDDNEKAAPSLRLKSRIRHFTVMINAIVKAPEHAGPANFDESSISSIGVGDPTANIDLIQPPVPNNRGTANIDLPIRLPAGRGSYMPELTLTYSSGGSVGLLGVGWDLPVSQVMVDDTNGVPYYDSTDQLHPRWSPIDSRQDFLIISLLAPSAW